MPVSPPHIQVNIPVDQRFDFLIPRPGEVKIKPSFIGTLDKVTKVVGHKNIVHPEGLAGILAVVMVKGEDVNNISVHIYEFNGLGQMVKIKRPLHRDEIRFEYDKKDRLISYRIYDYSMRCDRDGYDFRYDKNQSTYQVREMLDPLNTWSDWETHNTKDPAKEIPALDITIK